MQSTGTDQQLVYEYHTEEMGSGTSIKHHCQVGIQNHHILENLTAA